MTTNAIQISLDAIPPCQWATQKKPGWFMITMNHLDTREPIDSLQTTDKHDEAAVNDDARRTSQRGFCGQYAGKVLVVVYNHEGKATAAYYEGNKVA